MERLTEVGAVNELELVIELDVLEATRELEALVDELVGDGALLFGFGQRLKNSMMYGDTLIGALP